MTEINLWPLKPEMWECSDYKRSVTALPRYSSAVCPAMVRRTFAVGHVGLVFMIFKIYDLLQTSEKTRHVIYASCDSHGL
jgi:hypothetical protein